jgi:UDP-2,3-diacylglucosamine hydrolase
MRAVFLSDVHLKRRSDPAYERCLSFFSTLYGKAGGLPPGAPGPGQATVIDLLVIAGDFFDFWFERGGRIYPEFRPMVESLLRLGQSGVRICFCEGNHDFFLADYFSRQRGFEVHPDELELDLEGIRCLVSHGDLIDDRNWRYQTLRKWLRSWLAYRTQRALPLSWLWQIARMSSRVSRDAFACGSNRLMEVMHRYGVQKWREGFDAVVFGHCHIPTFREERIDGKFKTMATLGDWLNHQNYLLFENGRFIQKSFDPGAPHEVSL